MIVVILFLILRYGLFDENNSLPDHLNVSCMSSIRLLAIYLYVIRVSVVVCKRT